MFLWSGAIPICRRCRIQLRRFASTATLPPPPPPTGTVKLLNRRIISLRGDDATHFLNGITTATVRLGLTAGFYSAFLNAQGRMLHDVFIYPASQSHDYISRLPRSTTPHSSDVPAYFVDVDADEAEKLLKHLKRYRLRARVDIRLIDPSEWAVWSLWDERGSDRWTAHSSAHTSTSTSAISSATAEQQQAVRDGSIGIIDARAPGLGRRMVLPEDGAALPLVTGMPETNLATYDLRRYLRGVAEGQREIPYGAALPQEHDVDFMGGIDFRKGCYVGQELTIRTHHTGIVRKRILPAVLYRAEAPHTLEYNSDGIDFAADIRRDADVSGGVDIKPIGTVRGRSAGKWVAGIGNIGLALVRVEMMTDLVLTGEGSRWKEEDEFALVPKGSTEADQNLDIKIKAFVPDWIRNQTKAKTPNRQIA